MTRISATAVLLIYLALGSVLHAQPDRTLATDNGCFPWQDFKNGQCVAKPAQTQPPALPAPAPEPAVAPPPPAAPVVAAPSPPKVPPAPPGLAAPCPGGDRNLSGGCRCPLDMHYDAPSGGCLAEPITRASPQLAIVCDGGTVTNGACVCPAGFELMPVSDNAGGTCVRSNAENCLGGELTVSGKCMCNRQVTMDGETYLLEYSNGKCLPMRCPVTARLQDGHCVASPSPQLSSEPEPKPAKETRDADDPGPRHRCERGMIHTRSGCVSARRRLPEIGESGLRRYYRNFQFRGLGPN